MTNKRVLFIDHIFHKKTRSSDFFLEILNERFSVEVFYLEPGKAVNLGIVAAAKSVDIIVLWQMDFLAPVFLALGKPVIVVPMFDGSNSMPELHWHFSRQARLVNFSLALHERTRMIGNQSLLVRYFPSPVKESDLPRFDRLDAFFWQRRPDHGIDYEYVDALIGAELQSLHVHNAADVPGDFTPQISPNANYHYSVSNWFERKEEFEHQLNLANVFVAPRVAEGIGMALLEAMAKGMLVLAHDESTNNEYVSSWINGILFNKNIQPSTVHIKSDAERLSRMAWRTVVDGYEKWVNSKSAILDWVRDAPIPALTTREIDVHKFLLDLWYSYYNSMEEYVSFLYRNLMLIAELSGIGISDLIATIERPKDVSPTPSRFREIALDAEGMLDVTRPDDKYIGSGWGTAETDKRWVAGIAADLFFSSPVLTKEMVQGSFIAASLSHLGEALRCSIAMNNVVVFEGLLVPEWREYSFDVMDGFCPGVNRIDVVLEDAVRPPGDARMLSAAFKSFVFKY